MISLSIRRILSYNRWDEAKCLPVDVVNDDIFFSDDPVDEWEATEFCNGTADGNTCPLRKQCLTFALSTKTEYGVFGGMTPLGRAAILKKNKRHNSE
jgi:hypothetical protein